MAKFQTISNVFCVENGLGINKNDIFYVKHNGAVCECKLVSATITWYIGGGNYYDNIFSYDILLPNGEIIHCFDDSDFYFTGRKIKYIYKTINDCRYNHNHLSISCLSYAENMYKKFALDNKLCVNIERYISSRSNPIKCYYWNGFKAEETINVKIVYDILNGEFHLENNCKKANTIYTTNEECETDNSVKVVRFKETIEKPTKEQLRIKELEEIIAKAQAELSKINK